MEKNIQNNSPEEVRLVSYLESIKDGTFNSIEITIIDGKPILVKQKYEGKESIKLEKVSDIIRLIREIGHGTIKLGINKNDIQEVIKSIKLSSKKENQNDRRKN